MADKKIICLECRLSIRAEWREPKCSSVYSFNFRRVERNPHQRRHRLAWLQVVAFPAFHLALGALLRFDDLRRFEVPSQPQTMSESQATADSR